MLAGGSSDAKDGGHYEFQWHCQWGGPKTNDNGTSGWAKIVKSTNALHPPDAICRIHLCAHNPCQAVWPATKYGPLGPPMHLQEVQIAIEQPAQSHADPLLPPPEKRASGGDAPSRRCRI